MNRILKGIDDVENRIKELSRMGVKPDQLVIINLGDLVENCGMNYYANQLATLRCAFITYTNDDCKKISDEMYRTMEQII